MLLATWCGSVTCNGLKRSGPRDRDLSAPPVPSSEQFAEVPDSRIVYLDSTKAYQHPAQMALVTSPPEGYVDTFPRAVLPWSEIYGHEPQPDEWLPVSDGLQPGDAVGVIGTSSFYRHGVAIRE